MERQTEYDILKFVENQGRCYVSSDCMRGVLLPVHLKYHPRIPAETLLGWMEQILRELGKFHRCRGTPGYQYVNPFSMILGEDGRIHYLDLSSSRQQELLKKLQRRGIRESFLMPDNQYYQRATVEDDIYGAGRTFQYILAAADPVPPFGRGTRRKIRKTVCRCLKQTPEPDGDRRQLKDVREIADQLPRLRQRKKNAVRRSTGILTVVLAAAVVFYAGTRILPGGHSQSDEADSSRVQAAEPEQVQPDDLKFDMAMLYFLNLQDYTRSGELFREIPDNPMAERFAKLSVYLDEPATPDEQELADMLADMERDVPDQEDERYYLGIMKGYSLLEDDSLKKLCIPAGEHLLSLNHWDREEPDHKMEKSVRWQMADAYESAGSLENAEQQYRCLLNLEEENSVKEQIYLRLSQLGEESGNQEDAWKMCREGIEALPDSRLLRIRYMRMQCASPDTDRQICTQTIRTCLSEIPAIAEEPEFLKLRQEYGIRIEGEEVWIEG